MNNRLPPMSVVRWAAPLTVLALAITFGALYGVQLVVLTLAGGALLLVIFLLWSSVQALTGESELTFEEAFSFGARTAEEEQKRAVLRALKDLEYERSVGKISDDDYHEYSTRYRAEAKRLMQSLDVNLSEGRKQVERELERRLSKTDHTAKPEASGEEPASEIAATESAESEPSDPENAPDSSPKTSEPGPLACPACRTKNELDARFCKACGKSMTEAEGAKS